VIVSQDPMHVSFPVSTRVVQEVRAEAAARGRDPRAVRVKLRLPDGSIYGETGTIDFLDVRVDPATDTVTARAVIPNVPGGTGARTLFHGQLVGVIIEESEPLRALVIPQAAISVDQAGAYVLVVGADAIAQQRRIRAGSQHGTRVVVVEGLQAGEQVIVEGLQRARPGQRVTPRAHDAAAAQPGQPPAPGPPDAAAAQP
jgi:membrane fusion protein (multidrug efflux system)